MRDGLTKGWIRLEQLRAVKIEQRPCILDGSPPLAREACSLTEVHQGGFYA